MLTHPDIQVPPETEEFAINAQLRSSSTALADYMRSLFGSPPLPWEVDDSEPEVEISIGGQGGSSDGRAAPFVVACGL